jgi:hypothetical protein
LHVVVCDVSRTAPICSGVSESIASPGRDALGVEQDLGVAAAAAAQDRAAAACRPWTATPGPTLQPVARGRVGNAVDLVAADDDLGGSRVAPLLDVVGAAAGELHRRQLPFGGGFRCRRRWRPAGAGATEGASAFCAARGHRVGPIARAPRTRGAGAADEPARAFDPHRVASPANVRSGAMASAGDGVIDDHAVPVGTAPLPN